MEFTFDELRKALAGGKITPEQLAKAVNETLGLHGILYVEDLWNDIHKIPTAKETTTGPSMVSSGGGAEHGMKMYSNPAPQHGITKEYEALAGHAATYEEVSGLVKSAMETFGSTFSKQFISEFRKAMGKEPDPDPDPDPDHKAMKDDCVGKEPDPDPDPDHKSHKSHVVANLYARLSKAESEAAEVESEKEHDKEKMHEAKSFLSKVENYINEVEVSKSSSSLQTAKLQAESYLGKAWEVLSKARPVERHGLTGRGNQSDTAVPGAPETPLHEVEAKAKYWNNKLRVMKGEDEHMGKEPDPDPDPDHKSMGKEPDPDPDPDHKAAGHDGKAMYCSRFHGDEGSVIKAAVNHFLSAATGKSNPANVGAHKAVKDSLRRYAGYLSSKALIAMKGEDEHMGKEPDPDPDPDHKSMHKDPDPDPDHKAMGKEPDPDPDPDPDKKESQKSFNKNVADRLAMIEQNLSTVGNRPVVTPIIFSKGGITSEALASQMHDKVGQYLDDGHFTDDDAAIADNIIDKARAAGNGNIGITMHTVKAILEKAPIPVRNFFSQYDNTNGVSH